MSTSTDQKIDATSRCITPEHLRQYFARLSGAALDDQTFWQPIERLLTDEGLETQRSLIQSRQTLVAHLKGDATGPTLQWHVPLVLHEECSDPYFRNAFGTNRVTAAVATALGALTGLKRSNTLDRGQVAVIFYQSSHQLGDLLKDVDEQTSALVMGPIADGVPLASRGVADFRITISRPGPPVREHLRPAEEPSVIDAGMKVLQALFGLNLSLAKRTDAAAGVESIFVGQIHSGFASDVFPQSCTIDGRRRWLPSANSATAEQEMKKLFTGLARMTRSTIDLDFQTFSEGYSLTESENIVTALQGAVEHVSGEKLDTTPKPFIDVANYLNEQRQIPALTHGPKGVRCSDADTSFGDLEEEWLRVARTFASASLLYCGSS